MTTSFRGLSACLLVLAVGGCAAPSDQLRGDGQLDPSDEDDAGAQAGTQMGDDGTGTSDPDCMGGWSLLSDLDMQAEGQDQSAGEWLDSLTSSGERQGELEVRFRSGEICTLLTTFQVTIDATKSELWWSDGAGASSEGECLGMYHAGDVHLAISGDDGLSLELVLSARSPIPESDQTASTLVDGKTPSERVRTTYEVDEATLWESCTERGTFDPAVGSMGGAGGAGAQSLENYERTAKTQHTELAREEEGSGVFSGKVSFDVHRLTLQDP